MHGPTDADLERLRTELPTQTLHPWRATARTMIAASIAAIPIGQTLARELEVDAIPWIAAFLAIGTAITRLMAMPEVERLLQTHAPWLAASAYRGQHRKSETYDHYPIDDRLD